jgi:hypothetical protein
MSSELVSPSLKRQKQYTDLHGTQAKETEKQYTLSIDNTTLSTEDRLILKSLHPQHVKGQRKMLNSKGYYTGLDLQQPNNHYIPWDMRQLLPNRHRCCRKNLHICTMGRFVLVSLFIIMARTLQALYSC